MLYILYILANHISKKSKKGPRTCNVACPNLTFLSL